MEIEINSSEREILIVEDSPTQAEELKFLLQKNNYQVCVACNGREAIDLMNKYKPTIVISDIVMPEMDGYQLCKHIKSDETLKKIPVVLLTSLSDPGDVLKGLECGADNFMTKPYDEKILVSRLKYLIINKQFRETDRVQMGVEIFFGGQKYFITAERQQILDLLFSTYETAVWKNIELLRVQDELKIMNEKLEEKVEERTTALKAEIEERKKAEEAIRSSLAEKEVLLREIHHRVKNNMQIISSLLNLQLDVSKDKTVRDMFKESRNRVLSMSLIHEKLYQSKNLTDIDLRGYIEDIAKGLFESYGVEIGRIKLNIQVENVLLGIDSAIPCGLIINELVTNSLKYAFPGDKNGEIKISFRSTDDCMIELIIGDNGMGIPKSIDIGTVKSLGLHLVNILAENQLKGKIKLDRNKGTEFKITFSDVKK